MGTDYDECKTGECWKGQSIKLGGHRSFQYAQLLERTRWSLPKSSMKLAAATIPLAEGHDPPLCAGSFPISSSENEDAHKKSLLTRCTVSEEVAVNKALCLQYYLILQLCCY